MIKKIIKIKLLIAFGVIFGIILLQLITAYVFGVETKELVERQFNKITNSAYIKVTNYKYNRGFFSSDMEATIALSNQSINNIFTLLPKSDTSNILDNKYSITYKAHITQGIFAGVLRGEFTPTLATSKINILYPASISELFKKFFNTQDALQIKNTLYLNGSGKMSILSPSFNYKETLSEVSIKWDGLSLVTKYDKAFNSLDNIFSMPGFYFNAPGYGNVKIYGLLYKSHYTYSKNNIKVGDTVLNLNDIIVALSNDNKKSHSSKFMIGTMLNTFTGINAAQFIDEMDTIDPSNFTLKNISYASQSSDINNFFDANGIVKFESLATKNKTYGPLDLSTSINHISAPEFSKMFNEFDVLYGGNIIPNDKKKEQLIIILKKYFATILTNNPEFKINNLNLKTPSGLIALRGVIKTDNFTKSDINNNETFFKKIFANFSFNIPKDTLRYLLTLQMKYLLSAGNTDIDEKSDEALGKLINILLDNQINTWQKQKQIKEENGILTGTLIYKNGVLNMSE